MHTKKSFLFVMGGFLLLSLLSSCALPGTSSSSQDGLYGKNMIVNPGAESGPSDTAADTPVKSIPGWTIKGDPDVVPYGADGVAAKTDPGPTDRGNNLFTGGPDTANTSISQIIDLSSISSDIDAGTVSYTLSAYLGGYSGQDDNAVLLVQFENSAGTTVNTTHVGPVTATDRDSTTKLLQRTTTGKVPKGTAKVNVTLVLTRLEGAYNDGYADNLSLILQK